MKPSSSATDRWSGPLDCGAIGAQVFTESRVIELMDEVAMLRTQLSELRASPGRAPACASNDDAAIRADARLIKNVIDARGRRSQYLPPALFAEPAWDMLLDLFLAHLSQMRISVSSLCVAANVPTTTALRWLKTLQDHRLVERRLDPLDARRHFIALTPMALEAMTGYFSTLGEPPAVL